MTAGEARAGTGSRTIADLLPLAVKKYANAPALRHKVGDEWVDIPYTELGETVKRVGVGLIDLGIQPGDKVSILAHTRPEWTYACFGILTAGGTLVTIYQTNSPEECQYVLQHSDSRAVFVEDGTQLAKIREVEEACPELEHIIVLDPGEADLGDAISLDELCERGRRRDEAEWTARYQAVTPDDICL
ncbi:MAG: AMP-binding protein, partial [Pseudonocardiaceae bacterium]